MSQEAGIDFKKVLNLFTETEQKLLNKNPKNIYAVLNKITDFQWNYEVQKTWLTNSDSECHAIVVLDIGRRMQGVGSSSPHDTESLQESAVRDAIQNAFEKMVSTSTEEKHNEVPFSVQKEEIPILKKAPEPIKEEPVQREPQKVSTSVFTSRQVEKMLKFKEDFNIKNEEQLLAHLKTWNPSIQSKTQLNSDNIEDFFRYIDDLSVEVF